MSEKYDQDPSVPEYLRRKTIKTMPTDEPYYLHPEEGLYLFEDCLGQFWVNSAGRVCTASHIELHELQKGLEYRDEVIGRTGLMKVDTIDPLTDRVLEGYVADLRMVEPGTIDYDDSDLETPEDQEEANGWRAWKRVTITIDAFIYTDKDGMERRCGDERFLDAVDYLAASTDVLKERPEIEAHLERDQLDKTTKQQKNTGQKLRPST